MLIFASTDHRGSQIFFLHYTSGFKYLVKECSRKKYSITQMMFIVIQLIISHKERDGRVHGRLQESNIGAPPPLKNQKSI